MLLWSLHELKKTCFYLFSKLNNPVKANTIPPQEPLKYRCKRERSQHLGLHSCLTKHHLWFLSQSIKHQLPHFSNSESFFHELKFLISSIQVLNITRMKTLTSFPMLSTRTVSLALSVKEFSEVPQPIISSDLRRILETVSKVRCI